MPPARAAPGITHASRSNPLLGGDARISRPNWAISRSFTRPDVHPAAHHVCRWVRMFVAMLESE
jgi:hypothetical protein